MEIIRAVQSFIYPAVELFLLIFCLIKIKNPGGKLLAIGFGVNIISSLGWRILPAVIPYEHTELMYKILPQVNFITFLIFAGLFVAGISQIVKGEPAQQAITHKFGNFFLYITFLYVGFLMMIIGILFLIERNEEVGAIMLILGSLLLMVSAIYFMVLLYQVWRFIIDQSKAHNLTPSIETPGKAIGFLFIPFFNFYWIFMAYGKLPQDLNAVATVKNKPERMSEGMGTAIAVLTLVSIIPFLGYLTSIVNLLILIPMFLNKSLNICSILHEEGNIKTS